MRGCRIRAQGTRAIDHPAGDVRRRNRLRFGARVDPSIERRNLVEVIGAWSSLAVGHTRHHEQSHRSGGKRSDRFVDPLEHDQTGIGRNQGVGPAVIHQQLAAMLEEAREIRVAAIQQALVRLHRPLHIVRHLDAVVVPLRTEHDFPHPFVRFAGGSRSGHPSPSELRARIVTARV